MIRVYCTDKGWLSSCNGTVVYYKNLQEAMDAAYRKANSDGAPESSNMHRYYG